MKVIVFSSLIMSITLVSAANNYVAQAFSANSKCFSNEGAYLIDPMKAWNNTCETHLNSYKFYYSTDLSCVDGAKWNVPGIYSKFECATDIDAFAAKSFPGIKYFGFSKSDNNDCSGPNMVWMMAATGSCVKAGPLAQEVGAKSGKIIIQSNGDVTFNKYDSYDCSGSFTGGEVLSSQIGICLGKGKYFVGQGPAKIISFAVHTQVSNNLLAISISSILASILLL